MDDMVNMTNESAPATVFAFAPEDVSPVDTGNDAPTTSETAENPAEISEVSAPSATPQSDISHAFGKERKRIERQYEDRLANDPFRRIGKLMVEDLMTSGLSEEEAIEKVNDNWLKAVAKREGVSENIAKRLYAPKQTESPQNKIDRIVQEFRDAEKPQGFDAEAAVNDMAFIELLDRVPVDVAIRLYHAEHRAELDKQDLVEQLKARQTIPQATVPQQAATPAIDWRNVDDETFEAELARRKRSR